MNIQIQTSSPRSQSNEDEPYGIHLAVNDRLWGLTRQRTGNNIYSPFPFPNWRNSTFLITFHY